MNTEMNKSKTSTPAVYEPFRFFDEVTRDFFTPSFFRREGRSDLRTDIIDEGKTYVLKADLPGFKKENIRLDVSADTLTLCAVRENENREQNSPTFVRMERSYGTYQRQFDISGIRAEDIKASYTDGVLTVVLPKREEKVLTSRTVSIE